MSREITKNLLLLFCEKNSDGSKVLRLKGNELQRRIGKRIDNEDMNNIVEFLNEHFDIENLQLPYNRIGDVGLSILCNKLLSKENNITHLNLTGCDITHGGLEYLYLSRRTIVLKSLRLTGNPIGGGGRFVLADLLSDFRNLEHLDIGDTRQDLKSIPFVCLTLRSDFGANDVLKILDISNIVQNGCYYQMHSGILAEQIGEMIKFNNTLLEIHVQKCGFLGHDVEFFIRGLSINTALLMLDLGYNQIGNYGAELLGNWLESGPNLTGLNVAGNGIGECGALALSFGLVFSKIRLLDLSMNKINDEAMEILMMSIKKKVPMLMLFIWGNQLGPKVLKVIERQVKAEIYNQKNIDVLVYKVGDELQAAHYSSNNTYKHRYYCQLEHEEVRDIKIKRNLIPTESSNKAAKLNFIFYDKDDRSQNYKKVEC